MKIIGELVELFDVPFAGWCQLCSTTAWPPGLCFQNRLSEAFLDFLHFLPGYAIGHIHSLGAGCDRPGFSDCLQQLDTPRTENDFPVLLNPEIGARDEFRVHGPAYLYTLAERSELPVYVVEYIIGQELDCCKVDKGS